MRNTDTPENINARIATAIRVQARAAEHVAKVAEHLNVRANVTGDARDRSRPYVLWMRNVGSRVYHATVESAELSWIDSGQAACGRRLPRPGWVLTGRIAAERVLCSRCVEKLESMYPKLESMYPECPVGA